MGIERTDSQGSTTTTTNTVSPLHAPNDFSPTTKTITTTISTTTDRNGLQGRIDDGERDKWRKESARRDSGGGERGGGDGGGRGRGRGGGGKTRFPSNLAKAFSATAGGLVPFNKPIRAPSHRNSHNNHNHHHSNNNNNNNNRSPSQLKTSSSSSPSSSSTRLLSPSPSSSSPSPSKSRGPGKPGSQQAHRHPASSGFIIATGPLPEAARARILGRSVSRSQQLLHQHSPPQHQPGKGTVSVPGENGDVRER
ncbi:uncharacterized protein LOC143028278 [Oratosquilla oratoria]|uniref:uncharacterized protein LOC143028278 n=1 Tax=Oratosquilla oratoria TaxID=337810 RepID=UPI003F75AE9A